MLSRLVQCGRPISVQPVVWPKIPRFSNGNGKALHPERDSEASHAHPGPQLDYASAAEQQVGRLEAKVRELEQQVAVRAEESYQAGVRKGEAAAKEQSTARAEQMAARLAESLAEVGQARARALREAESDVLRLSLAIARRILYRELTVDPEAMQGLVRVALDKLQNEKILSVRVHPEQEQTLRAVVGQLGRAIEVSADPGLERGSIVFDTERGRLDASLETQLQEIDRGLTDRFRN
jgi:flagellar assembly protein FliH